MERRSTLFLHLPCPSSGHIGGLSADGTSDLGFQTSACICALRQEQIVTHTLTHSLSPFLGDLGPWALVTIPVSPLFASLASCNTIAAGGPEDQQGTLVSFRVACEDLGCRAWSTIRIVTDDCEVPSSQRSEIEKPSRHVSRPTSSSKTQICRRLPTYLDF